MHRNFHLPLNSWVVAVRQPLLAFSSAWSCHAGNSAMLHAGLWASVILQPSIQVENLTLPLDLGGAVPFPPGVEVGHVSQIWPGRASEG